MSLLDTMKNWLQQNVWYVLWGVALIATLGSLTFSEILGYPPCILCWYQRICMYPLVVIFTVRIITKDKFAIFYALPLAVVGLLISIYHNLLYYNILPEAAAPCRNGVSCTTKFIEWFGFITIPFLSLTAFVIIAGLLYWQWRVRSND
jgi:disulfide bond formation protein DsbB